MDQATPQRRKYAKREPQFEGLPSAADLDAVAEEEKIAAATAPPVVMAPPPPNPAVIALQEDIVNLVRSRGTVRAAVNLAHAQLLNAQNAFQIAQLEMKALEDEVQYLHGQCAQLDGRRGEVSQIDAGRSFEPLPFPGGYQSVSSEPTMPQINRSFAPPDGINRAHASRDVL